MGESYSKLRDAHYRKNVDDFVRSAGYAGLTALSALASSVAIERQVRPDRTNESSSDQVGAWRVERQDHRTVLRRNLKTAEQRYWADLEEMSLESSDFKVALLGESVARGYLLDPALTPASALQGRLNSNSATTKRAVKVIDLAKTDLTLDDLDEMIARLDLIQPDAVVLFVGNNVARLILDPSAICRLAAALEQGGMPALQRLWRDELAPARIVHSLRRLAESVHDPASVTVVIPEFNLLGWRECEIAGLPWRPEKDMRSWFASRDILDQTECSPEHEVDRRDAVRRMQEADEGLGWRTHWEQGRAAHIRGCAEEARDHFENARDCKACIFVPHTPRCTASMQMALQTGAMEFGFGLVDLREVLCTSDSLGLPDRRFFLDYCHLSAEGIDQTTRAIDQVIRRRHREVFGKSEAREHDMLMPCQSDTATSLLLAAVHNAHYGQPTDVFTEYVEGAFETDPSIAEVGEHIVSLLTDVGPTWSNRSFQAISTHPMLKRYFSGVDGAIGGKFEDTTLINALLDKICENRPNNRASFFDRLKTTMLVDGLQDLTDPIAHAQSFRALHNYTYHGQASYLKAFDREQRFRFVVAKPNRKIRLSLCFRAAAATEQPLEISVNGRWLISASCPRRWTRIDVIVDEHAILPDINTAMLTWPTTPSPSVHPERLCKRLARGVEVDALAWFGEIFSFNVESIVDEDDSCF